MVCPGLAQNGPPSAGTLEPYRLAGIPKLTKCENVLLSAQPSEPGLALAASVGVTTVIDLRQPNELRGFDEQAVVEEHGMRYVPIPFNGGDAFTDEVMDRVRRELKAADGLVLVHCASANRVGAVWFPYRVLDGGVGVDASLAEAKRVGLKTPVYTEKALAYIKRHAE